MLIASQVGAGIGMIRGAEAVGYPTLERSSRSAECEVQRRGRERSERRSLCLERVLEIPHGVEARLQMLRCGGVSAGALQACGGE
jgi:hypothetical protein